MERLTEDSVTGETYIKQCASSCPYDGDFCGTDECPVLNAVADKLAEYEQLEEQGLLVRLPCHIGTTVWDICGMDIRENVLSGIECGKDGKQFLWANHDEWLGELNDLVFLTREEAKKKLEEMRNEWLRRKSCRTFK